MMSSLVVRVILVIATVLGGGRIVHSAFVSSRPQQQGQRALSFVPTPTTALYDVDTKIQDPPIANRGPPPGVGGGGPPKGVGRPPTSSGGGPPGTGGPPEQTLTQKLLEGAFEVAFSLLYVGDDSGVRDSSKNLRVLWTRALLANLNKINDPIAYELLPTKTRWIVGQSLVPLWSDGVVGKLDWIVNRTNFIDSQLQEFMEETAEAPKRQVIVLGSGYDTRSLRCSKQGVKFFEVDLPDISSTKSDMVNRYMKQNPTDGSIIRPVHIPFDLNEVLTKNRSLLEALEQAGLEKEGVPTMVVCEAVLFYLIPAAVQKLVGELFGLESASRFCITDNLSKVGVAPGPPVPTPREKCEKWLQDNGKELVAHDAIWGGAIHFVGAK